MVTARVEIKKIRTHQPETGFTVAEVEFISYEGETSKSLEPLITGTFPSIFVGDEFEIEANWKQHPVFGHQLNVLNAVRSLPQTKKGLQAFISKHVKGIGKTTSNRIVETFGEETLQVIETDYKRLTEVKGIKEEKAKEIYDLLFQHQRFEPIAVFVLNNGGSYKLALWAYETFGDLAIQRIRENPYSLLEFDSTNFRLADQFAKDLKVSPFKVERIEEGILAYLRASVENRGDLFVLKREVLEELGGFLEKRGAYGAIGDISALFKVSKEAIANLIEKKKIVIEQSEEHGELIYLQIYFHMEVNIVKKLKSVLADDRLSCVPAGVIGEWATKYEEKNNRRFAKKQKEGIRMALTNGFSILTGGPGTGKTQTINAIIQCLLETKPYAEVHLLAPTGKASKRMTELTNMEAKTIHRAIGIGRSQMDADEATIMLEGDLVVVDESSMMDIFICYRLLYAIENNVTVLLVGDVDQLPSVGAGLILRDLIESKIIPTTVLDEVFRQAGNSQIVVNAHKLIRGMKTTDVNGISWDESKGDFQFIERKSASDAVQAIVEQVKHYLNNGYSMEDIQVLTPQKRSPLGTMNLNIVLQEAFNPRDRKKKEVKNKAISFFREGDRLIQMENNPELEVFNGDVGTLDMIFNDKDKGISLRVIFPDENEVIYTLEEAEEQLELAYALTVHKSQGSEYPVVIVPIHSTLKRMLNRNLVYTGWTRAKEILCNVGEIDALNDAVDRVDQTLRNSQIRYKLSR